MDSPSYIEQPTTFTAETSSMTLFSIDDIQAADIDSRDTRKKWGVPIALSTVAIPTKYVHFFSMYNSFKITIPLKSSLGKKLSDMQTRVFKTIAAEDWWGVTVDEMTPAVKSAEECDGHEMISINVGTTERNLSNEAYTIVQVDQEQGTGSKKATHVGIGDFEQLIQTNEWIEGKLAMSFHVIVKLYSMYRSGDANESKSGMTFKLATPKDLRGVTPRVSAVIWQTPTTVTPKNACFVDEQGKPIQIARLSGGSGSAKFSMGDAELLHMHEVFKEEPTVGGKVTCNSGKSVYVLNLAGKDTESCNEEAVDVSGSKNLGGRGKGINQDNNSITSFVHVNDNDGAGQPGHVLIHGLGAYIKRSQFEKSVVSFVPDDNNKRKKISVTKKPLNIVLKLPTLTNRQQARQNATNNEEPQPEYYGDDPDPDTSLRNTITKQNLTKLYERTLTKMYDRRGELVQGSDTTGPKPGSKIVAMVNKIKPQTYQRWKGHWLSTEDIDLAEIATKPAEDEPPYDRPPLKGKKGDPMIVMDLESDTTVFSYLSQHQSTLSPDSRAVGPRKMSLEELESELAEDAAIAADITCELQLRVWCKVETAGTKAKMSGTTLKLKATSIVLGEPTMTAEMSTMSPISKTTGPMELTF